jgi:hypothetical protein
MVLRIGPPNRNRRAILDADPQHYERLPTSFPGGLQPSLRLDRCLGHGLVVGRVPAGASAELRGLFTPVGVELAFFIEL